LRLLLIVSRGLQVAER